MAGLRLAGGGFVVLLEGGAFTTLAGAGFDILAGGGHVAPIGRLAILAGAVLADRLVDLKGSIDSDAFLGGKFSIS